MRRAVVTGAASGIGAAAVQTLLADGCEVIGLDIQDARDGLTAFHRIDLDDPSATLPVFGGIDVLVNAAGLPPRDGLEAKILQVNFLALRRVTTHVLSGMPQGGSIVNVASKAGARWRENIEQVRKMMAQPDDARLAGFVAEQSIDPVRAYDLSKEAVVAWTKAMAAPLLERGIRMNCVSPAAIDTPLLGDFTRAFGHRAERGVELTRRAGTAGEVATVIAFLANPASSWVRGCNIEADGGLTAMLETEAIIGEITDDILPG